MRGRWRRPPGTLRCDIYSRWFGGSGGGGGDVVEDLEIGRGWRRCTSPPLFSRSGGETPAPAKTRGAACLLPFGFFFFVCVCVCVSVFGLCRGLIRFLTINIAVFSPAGFPA
ncbi:Os03g0700600, partial [Oryza sativa Japonica Group]